MNPPLVSVVMINYNGMPWLEPAARSVMASTGVEIELLIVDDGSSDGSREMMAQLAGEDGRVRPLPLSENGGISVARNRGIEESRGEFIALIDSDDLYLPHTLRDMLAAFNEAKKSRPDICFLATDAWLISEKGERFGRYITPTYWGKLMYEDSPKWTLPSTWFFPKAVPVRFFEPYKVGEAPIFVERMSAHGSIAFLGEPLVEYRMRTKSVSNVSGRRTLRGLNASVESIRLGRLDNPLRPEEVPNPCWRQTAAWIHGRNAKNSAVNGKWLMATYSTIMAAIADPARTFGKVSRTLRSRRK